MKWKPVRVPELRKRIFIAFSLFILLFGVLSSLLAASIVGTVARDQLAKQLTEEAVLVIDHMETQGVKETLSNLVLRARVTHIRSDGTVLFDSRAQEPFENHLDRPEVQDALSSGSGHSTRYSQTMRTQTVYVAVRLADGSILRLSQPERVASSIVTGIAPFLIFGIILMMLLSMPMANYFSIRLLKPILTIDLEHPEEAVAFDEMLPLIRRIDAQNRQNRTHLEALDARRQELDTLLGGMHEGFIALGSAEEIILINPSACAMLGASAEQALGRHLTEINRSAEMFSLLEGLRKSGSANGMLLKDGRSYFLSASMLQNRRGAVLLFYDQTEQLRGEEMRKDFTANVSHELRTPLTTICGYAELLKNNMVKGEDLEQFYGLIHRETSRLLTLVEDILRLSKLDEGHPGGQRQKVNLCEVVSSVCHTFALPATERGVSLSFSGQPAFVRGDVTLLDELAGNLVDNAIKYNVDGGKVEVSVIPGSRVLLIVRDTGIGISPEHQPRVFERFYRTDTSRSKATGGTGLGLSIVKHAAEYHHAKITLKSQLGQGTEITVAFPPWQEEG
jgi:two-component system phosphate regulon sensor histidine kinase PhoR